MEIPLAVVELDHVVLRCRDLPQALDFYTRLLGLREERRLPELGLVQLRAGRSMVDLLARAEPSAGAEKNLDHFCLAIETADLAEVIGYLRANGVEILGEPTPRYGARGMGLSIYVRDPENNLVELKQVPARLPQDAEDGL